jgi:long-chain fatty acid transport protein
VQRKTGRRTNESQLAIVALAWLLASSGVLASGFQLQEQSASGLGVAYSGMAAAVQDGSTVFWNPAGLSWLGGSGVALSADYIIPSFKFTSSPGGSTYEAFGDGGNGGVSTLVPAFYAYTTLNPQLALGLAVNAPFGLSTEWDNQWAGMFYAIKSKVQTLNINPAVSWKVNEHFALAAGVSYEQLKATLTNGVTPLIPTAQARLDGSDWQWGWNVGALVDFGQGTRLGATYRSAIGYTISGNLSFNDPAFAPLASGVKADLRLPHTFSLALSQKITEQLRLLMDFSATGWNSIGALTVIATSGPAAGMPVSNTPLNFNNSWRAGAGIEYQINAPWLVRAGVAYDRSPVQDAYRDPRLPDDDRTWLAAGARFEPAPGWAIDLGYAYLWIKNATSELSTPAGSPFPNTLFGTYKSSTSILGLQVAYHF